MIQKRNPAQTAARRARRARSLGATTWCVLCPPTNPVTDPMALHAVRRDALPLALFEQHHVLGRRNAADATVTLCLNHHAIVHEGCREIGADFTKQPTVLHVLDVVLRALAVFLRLLAQSFEQWGSTLLPLITQLDSRFPNWRMLEGV
jgi:hypothetical protein